MSYGRVFNKAMFFPGISLEAKGLYGILCSLCGTKNFCYPTVKTLCELSGKSRATVHRLLTELTNAGIISRGFDTKKNKTITVHLLDTTKDNHV